jgi:hypothetical protein
MLTVTEELKEKQLEDWRAGVYFPAHFAGGICLAPGIMLVKAETYPAN